MKRTKWLGVLPLLCALLTLPLHADNGSTSIGVNIGGMPVWMLNTYSAGVELGYKISPRLELVFEAVYGYLPVSSISDEGKYYDRSDIKLSTLPITLTLLYNVPVTEKITLFAGGGLGYHHIALDFSQESRYGSEYEDTSEDSATFNAVAPHISLGFETRLGKKVALRGQVKQIFGTSTMKRDYEDYVYKLNVGMGGTAATLGVRFYLGKLKV